MPRGQKFKAEEIIAKLREAEVELARGKKILEACKQIGVTEQTYYRWKKKSTAVYGWIRRSGSRIWRRRTLVLNRCSLTRSWTRRS